MKLSLLANALLTSSLLLATAHATAADPITLTGSAALTTDYLFRGVSQTSNGSAAQVGMTFTHESGAYFSLWGSNLTAFSGASFQSSGLELDTLLGYSGKAGEVAYDVGVMRYNYPGLSPTNNCCANAAGKIVDADFNEFYASVSAMGLKGGLAYTSDYFNEAGKFSYLYVNYSTTVSDIGLYAGVGINKFDSAAMMTQALGTVGKDDSYMDYKIAASKTLAGIGFEGAYIGSDIDEKDCGGGVCQGRFVVTMTKGF